MHDAHHRREGVTVSGASILTVAVLTLAMTLSYCDRYLITLAIEPIKRDLGLSDTAVSLVQGFSFALFFVGAGLPLGMLVDRTRRVAIVAAGVTLWSVATCACGLVDGFGGLLVCRIAVAVGEATLTPAAFSIFADILPRHRLGLGSGMFSLGIYLGAGVAFLGGAAVLATIGHGGADLPIVGHRHDWQALFLLVGLLGAPIALWIALLREPPRGGMLRNIAPASIADVLAFLRGRRSLLAALFLCAGFAALSSQAYAAWMPSHLVRDFGWSVPQAGGVSGLVIIGGGLAGVLVAGLVGDALRRRGLQNGRLIVMVGSGLLAAPPALAAPLIGDARAALLLMLATMFCTTVLLTSAAPAIQELLPNRMQGTVIALYALVVTLVGLGVGPMAVALVSDHLLGGGQRIGASLACVSVLAMGASVLLGWSALRSYATQLVG